MTYEELLSLENTSQSDYSPCIVANDENLARVLFTPRHIKDNKVLPVAFEPEIFKALSVLREKYDFQNCLDFTISQLEKDDGSYYYAYVLAKVCDIRDIRKNEFRLFYIVDSATKEKKGHADICAIRTNDFGLPKKALKQYIRYEISLVFNNLVKKIA